MLWSFYIAFSFLCCMLFVRNTYITFDRKKSNLIHYCINPCVYFSLHISCWPKERRACLIDHRQWEKYFHAKKLTENIRRAYLVLSFYRRYLLSFIGRVFSVIFKPLSYCFEEAIGFDLTVSFVSCPVSRLIRLYNKSCNITKEFC